MSKSCKIAENETILYEHFDSTITITDKRIKRKHSLDKDALCCTSMMLKDVTSIDVRNNDEPWILAMGIIAGIAGISGLLEFQSWGLDSLLVSIVLVIYFFSSRDFVIEFRRPEMTVKLSTRCLKDSEVMNLVSRIVQLKTG